MLEGNSPSSIPGIAAIALDRTSTPAAIYVAQTDDYNYYLVISKSQDRGDTWNSVTHYDLPPITFELSTLGDSMPGNLFRFDAASGQYIYNLSTQTFLAPATYRIRVALDDGTSQTVDFSLRR